MAKKDIIRKLTSRKLWIAVAALVSGLILAFGGKESTAQTVSGVILQAAAVLGYLLSEGLADAAGAGNAGVFTYPTTEGVGDSLLALTYDVPKSKDK